MIACGTILHKDYRVESLLGQGGMASVYLVSHMRFPRKLALKIITAQLDQDPGFVARFQREAHLLAKLKHPHIISVSDFNTYQGHPYMVMELLDGTDLSVYLRERGRIASSTALAIFKQVGEALQYAHNLDIIHRDLKPANLFACRADSGAVPHIKVLDFGLAKLLRQTPDCFHTQDSWAAGTPAYMSPEQADARHDLDARSDQFSLAVILYELLSGQRAFHRPGDHPGQILRRVLEQPLPAPLPWPAVHGVIERATCKAREERFSSVQHFMDAVYAAAGTLLETTSVDAPRSAAQSQVIDLSHADIQTEPSVSSASDSLTRAKSVQLSVDTPDQAVGQAQAPDAPDVPPIALPDAAADEPPRAPPVARRFQAGKAWLGGAMVLVFGLGFWGVRFAGGPSASKTESPIAVAPVVAGPQAVVLSLPPAAAAAVVEPTAPLAPASIVGASDASSIGRGPLPRPRRAKVTQPRKPRIVVRCAALSEGDRQAVAACFEEAFENHLIRLIGVHLELRGRQTLTLEENQAFPADFRAPLSRCLDRMRLGVQTKTVGVEILRGAR